MLMEKPHHIVDFQQQLTSVALQIRLQAITQMVLPRFSNTYEYSITHYSKTAF